MAVGSLPEACPFLFNGLLACPDFATQSSQRRRENAPRVSIAEFVEVFTHRAEHQWGADWSFSYLRWNYFFRTSLNASRVVAAPRDVDGSCVRLEGRDVLQGAEEISRALRGSYKTAEGFKRPVGGDLCKVMHVSGLSVAAKHLLRNAFYAMQRLPGTSGVRRRMRFISKSMQVYYGLPVFITLSPDEKHCGIMFRMMRTRATDPAFAHVDGAASFGLREKPWLDTAVAGQLPAYSARRAALAQKPAAAAVGFRVHLALILRAAFGLRFCLHCPRCALHKAADESLCCDLLGNNSVLEGGAFALLRFMLEH